ncbi:hypothetical protein PQR34_43820 [Paraburkholderia sediminicola]|uniref:hypothetical protein n=1 Tax=Paraburkholderia sediminicola TaxID=458836 RepID=UPI0038B986B0
MTTAIHALAEARAALVTATEKAEVAHAANNALLVRLTEACAKSSEAVRDARDGKIDEATAALRMSIADQDAKDIQVLLDKSPPVLASLDAAVLRAQAQAAKAEFDARKEENELTAIELTNHVDNLHAALTEAIQERHQYCRKVGLHVAAADLLKRIKALEHQLLEAIAECYDIHVEMDPPRSPASRRTSSVHDFYKPSLALQDVVRQGAKPRF